MEIVSAASIDGFYYKPRVDHDFLRKHSEGLIALSACLGGEVQKNLLKEDYEKANAAKVAENSGANYVKTATGFVSPNHIFENVNDINIIQKYAPKIKQMKIREDQIKLVIGRGGDVITKIIQDASGVKSVNDKNAIKIDIEDDGRIMLYHNDINVIEKAANMILDITREVEEGKLYNVKVVKIESFGCFVEVWPGCEGLVHISKLAKDRVSKVEDVVHVGDMIVVKAMGVDNKGRLNFSRKDAL